MQNLPNIPVANACHLAAFTPFIPVWSFVQVHEEMTAGYNFRAAQRLPGQ